MDFVVGVDDKGYVVGYIVGVEDICGLVEFVFDVGEYWEG